MINRWIYIIIMQEKVKLNSRNFSEGVVKIWLETCFVRQTDRQIEYEAKKALEMSNSCC